MPKLDCELVFIDCDSTLSAVEGYDTLARRAGIGRELAAMTRAAMDGDTPLEAVFAERLQRLSPSRADIDWLAGQYLEHQVQGGKALISALVDSQHQVHIISGGLRAAILPLATELGIADEQVHAVDIIFDDDGHYQGFDQNSPLTRAGGKAEVCRELLTDGQRGVMIGDGGTDLETSAAGVTVIGFGGVCKRLKVMQKADYFFAGPGLAELIKWFCND